MGSVLHHARRIARRINGHPTDLVHRREKVNGRLTAWAHRASTAPNPTEHPLVLVPGLSMSWWAYLWLLEQIPADREVLIIDPPGAGRSARLQGPMDSDAQAHHLAAWLDHIDRSNVDIVGHSLGAVTAARLAGQRSDLVRTLCLISPSPDDRWPHMRNHVGALVRGSISESPRVMAQAAGDYLRANPSVLKGFRDQLGASADDVMRGVTCPVLVLRGDQDRVSSAAWCRELTAAGGGRITTIPDGAHGLPQQHPERLWQELSHFHASSRADLAAK